MRGTIDEVYGLPRLGVLDVEIDAVDAEGVFHVFGRRDEVSNEQLFDRQGLVVFALAQEGEHREEAIPAKDLGPDAILSLVHKTLGTAHHEPHQTTSVASASTAERKRRRRNSMGGPNLSGLVWYRTSSGAWSSK